MVFVPFQRDVRVSLGVVTLGTPERLRGCLEALVGHQSRHDFTVVVVVNADTPDGAPPELDLPEGVLADPVPVNLGWAGGLHRARALTDAELLVWVQDDMVPEPGWLDALVDAADSHPGVGGFGAVRVDDEGRVVVHNAGRAEPPDAVERWNDTDTTPEALPAGVTTYDWVTSKGFLTRAAVFDELGGPDPRLWPLNHVDKDYCTHLRCHGYDVALVPGARLRHGGSRSAPTTFRAFLADWREPWINRRWTAALAALAGRSSAVVDHPCAEWRTLTADAVSVASTAEASRMVVPLSRALATQAAELDAVRMGMLDDMRAHADRVADAHDASTAHASHLQEALTAAEDERDRARRRVRRLRRRLRRLESSTSWRLTRPLRTARRRLRGWHGE
jgi:GT2 family glycosyltransferase